MAVEEEGERLTETGCGAEEHPPSTKTIAAKEANQPEHAANVLVFIGTNYCTKAHIRNQKFGTERVRVPHISRRCGDQPLYCPATLCLDAPPAEAYSGPGLTITVPFIPLVSCNTQT